MKITENLFKGEAPRIAARALPPGYAQSAIGAKLLSGDLEAWLDLKQDLVQVRTGAVGSNTTAATLAKASPINTISLMARQYWLQWRQAELMAGETNVDATLGPVPGDLTYRTFFTGTGAPQVTNIDLATAPANQGAAAQGAYPYVSKTLGAPAPTVAPTVTQTVTPTSGTAVTKTYDGSDISDWRFQNTSAGGGAGSWVVSAAVGNPQPSFYGIAANNGAGRLLQNFGFTAADIVSFTTEFDIQINNNSNDVFGYGLFAPALADSLRVITDDSTYSTPALLFEAGSLLYQKGTGEAPATIASGVPTSLMHLKVVGTFNNTTSVFDITITITGGLSLTLSTVLKPKGDLFIFEYGSGSGGTDAFLDNLSFIFTPLAVVGDTPVYTEYVYTDVNSFGQESAPSPASDPAVTVPDANTVNHVTIPAPGGGADVSYRNLYRAASGSAGTQFFFVAQVNSPYAVYNDTTLTENLGAALLTTTWIPPPAGMRGILALPNGVMAGFVGNQLCLSVPNFPHAWPLAYRLTVASAIVAIAAIDSNVAILTESNPYIAFGDDPAAFSMTKEEFISGCQSKRSVAYMRGVGVLYANPEGVAAYSGQGRAPIITRMWFTREQWQALNPPSMIGLVHDDRYFFWYTTLAGVKGGYILDQREDGFGLVPLDFHPTAVFVDPLTDTMYIVIDQGDAYLSNSLVTPPANAVVIWNAAPFKQAYTWKSKVYQLPIPTSFMACQIKADDYASLNLRIFYDGVQVYNAAVANSKPFTLPDKTGEVTFEFQLTGTSRVTQVEFAETMDDLT